MAAIGIGDLVKAQSDKQEDQEASFKIVKGPYLQWPTQHSMKIMWETSEPASSSVTFFETRRPRLGSDGKLESVKETEKTVNNAGLTSIHCVTLTSLKVDTSYNYVVKSRNSAGRIVESGEHSLKTAVLKDGPFSFAVTSETGGYGAYNKPNFNEQLFGQLVRYRPDFTVFVGDVVGSGRTYEEWDSYFFGPGRNLFVNTPFYLVLGNHELGSPLYYDFVSYPDPENYYSFDYGNAHFTVLDCTLGIDDLFKKDKIDEKSLYSNPEKLAFSSGSPQYEFLLKDLASSKADWKFVFFHYPPYVSGNWEIPGMRVLCPIFEKYGVDIVFNSHTIVYERSYPIRSNKVDMDNGVIYIVAGGAGTSNWFYHKRAWHTAQALSIPHFVQVCIAGKTLELRAIDVDGRPFDVMTLTKPRRK
ncbi:MAG: metallophosphoesterase family protein [Armatimonadetes bacterium]|nr:metallophosphoesterase family protein [Armatimonadota bacterium]